MFRSYAICQYFREKFIISGILEVIIVIYTLYKFIEQHAFWKTKLEERVGLSKLLIKERLETNVKVLIDCFLFSTQVSSGLSETLR